MKKAFYTNIIFFFSQKYAYNRKNEFVTIRSSNCSVKVKFCPMLVENSYFGGVINPKPT